MQNDLAAAGFGLEDRRSAEQLLGGARTYDRLRAPSGRPKDDFARREPAVEALPRGREIQGVDQTVRRNVGGGAIAARAGDAVVRPAVVAALHIRQVQRVDGPVAD